MGFLSTAGQTVEIRESHKDFPIVKPAYCIRVSIRYQSRVNLPNDVAKFPFFPENKKRRAGAF
jgi:hypothetical protein